MATPKSTALTVMTPDDQQVSDMFIQEEKKYSKSWLRRKGEPAKYYGFFEAYLAMGPNRTIKRTAMEYYDCKTEGQLVKWYQRATRYNWPARAAAYDSWLISEEREKYEYIMSRALAQDYGRIEQLIEIGEWEIGILRNIKDRIVADPDAMFENLHRRYKVISDAHHTTLNALAQETGGRVKRISVTRELTDYARELARDYGYDEQQAIAMAKQLAIESEKG